MTLALPVGAVMNCADNSVRLTPYAVLADPLQGAKNLYVR